MSLSSTCMLTPTMSSRPSARKTHGPRIPEIPKETPEKDVIPARYKGFALFPATHGLQAGAGEDGATSGEGLALT